MFVSCSGIKIRRRCRGKRPGRDVICRLSAQRDEFSPETEGPTLKFLLAASGAVARLQQESADMAQAGLSSALEALGVGDESDDKVDTPQEPRFDAVTAQVLTGYAFRAYEDPSPGCYREVRETIVRGSVLSGRQRQVIIAHYAFPDADVIGSTAEGLFQIALRAAEDYRDICDMYVVCRVNAAVRLDVMRDDEFSIIRRRHMDDEDGSRVEIMTLDAYESEKAYDEGHSPLLCGMLDLTDVVDSARRRRKPMESGRLHMLMKAVSMEQAGNNFFGISLLPENVRSPLQKFEQFADHFMNSSTIDEATVLIDVVYIPFDITSPQTAIEESFNGEGCENDVQADNENIYGEGSALQEALREKLAPGQLPLPSNWATLAKGVRELADKINPEGRPTVRENIGQSLFVESHNTGTEAWLFHDDQTRNIIISFRGTEDISWQDFYTDAQMFLQKWQPGDEIDLNLRPDLTVGLSALRKIANSVVQGEDISEEESTVNSEASCVHYGFLRAYHSVRDAVLHAVDMLVGEHGRDYQFFFVGHSLGGALAKLCACDMAFLKPQFANQITCLSYGAPKAGNVGFAKMYNALVKNSFRIVNDADLIVRMPKSIGNRPCERYRHVGRTVLVNENGEIWVEGEDEDNGTAIDPFRDRFTDLNHLLEYEQEMWSQLVSGRSLRHHMEDSYFLAMTEVLRRSVQ